MNPGRAVALSQAGRHRGDARPVRAMSARDEIARLRDLLERGHRRARLAGGAEPDQLRAGRFRHARARRVDAYDFCATGA